MNTPPPSVFARLPRVVRGGLTLGLVAAGVTLAASAAAAGEDPQGDCEDAARDLVSVAASMDEGRAVMTITTAQPFDFATTLVFFDTDANAQTGYRPAGVTDRGFDLLASGGSLSRHHGDDPSAWRWESVGATEQAVAGNVLTLSFKASLLGGGSPGYAVWNMSPDWQTPMDKAPDQGVYPMDLLPPVVEPGVEEPQIIAAPRKAHADPRPNDAMLMATSDGPVPIHHWGYQLQGGPADDGLLPDALSAAPHDLIVIDHARFGDAASRFTPAEVAAIKTRADGDGQRRVVAAYLSIGESSEFRSFWDQSWTDDGSADSPLRDHAPRYLGPVNPDWPESRKVRYWDAAWQEVLFNEARTGWLDTIVAQGFDAAYLDIVDAYYFWGETMPAKKRQAGDPDDGQDAARRMIDLIVALTAHARQSNPRFFVIPQNGAFILNDADYAGPLPEDPARRAAFLDAIGAIGVEDVYCGGDLDEDNPFGPDRDTITVLKKDFLTQGKPVFAVDYLTDPAIANRFVAAAFGDGFTPYVAPNRRLDVMAAPVIMPDKKTSLTPSTTPTAENRFDD